MSHHIEERYQQQYRWLSNYPLEDYLSLFLYGHESVENSILLYIIENALRLFTPLFDLCAENLPYEDIVDEITALLSAKERVTIDIVRRLSIHMTTPIRRPKEYVQSLVERSGLTESDINSTIAHYLRDWITDAQKKVPALKAEYGTIAGADAYFDALSSRLRGEAVAP
jgi:hypothetical protein